MARIGLFLFRERLKVPLAMLINIIDHPGFTAALPLEVIQARLRTDMLPPWQCTCCIMSHLLRLSKQITGERFGAVSAGLIAPGLREGVTASFRVLY